MQQFVAGSSATPITLVELTLSCRNLCNMDTFSKSDPFIVVSMTAFGTEPRDNKWNEVQRTEVIYDNLDPDFATKISLAYHFEELQYLKFDVYDKDSSSCRLTAHDFLGSCTCTLAQLMTSTSDRHQLFLTDTPTAAGVGKKSVLLVHAEEMVSSKQRALFTFAGRRLDKKDWFWNKSDPYLELFKSTESAGWVLVHRTEHIRRTLNPDWRPFSVTLSSLCGGDRHSTVRAVCWDWNASGRSELIGECCFTVDQLERLAADCGAGDVCSLDCIHPEKQKEKGGSYKNSGTILVRRFEIQQCHSFLDYISAGTQLACTIAIDFTASNGDPRSPDSLHHLARDRLTGNIHNPYVTALRAVGEIIQEYDSDRAFPVLGFGARIPPAGVVSHEFFVNMRADHPFCYHVQGVVEAYQQCLPKIQLYGPTNFAPVIRHVANFAAQHRDGSQYFILLILTDGVITDMQHTKQAIVDASCLPLSIIIVGVGSADFSAMEELDGDHERLSDSRGRRAQRDIVQFVAFNKFTAAGGVSGGSSGGAWRAARTQLAREVLAEVPCQFLGYMTANRIEPMVHSGGEGASLSQPLPADPSLL